MHPHRLGTLQVALSGVLYGVMSCIGMQLLYLNFSVENMLFWRFLIATFWVFGALLLRKNLTLKISSRRLIIKTFIFGAICYSCASVFYFLACQQIGTGLAMVIFFSFPVFVSLFSWLSGTWQMNKYAFISLLAVVMGLLLLKGSGDSNITIWGMIFAISGAVFFAAYIFGSQHSIKNIDAGLLAFLVCVGNTIFFFIWSCWTQKFILPTTFNAWFYICAIGILSTALPIQLLLNGLRYVSPVKASILSVLEPVVTVLIGFMLLGETMSSLQAVGVLIILVGAILIQFERVPELSLASE